MVETAVAFTQTNYAASLSVLVALPLVWALVSAVARRYAVLLPFTKGLASAGALASVGIATVHLAQAMRSPPEAHVVQIWLRFARMGWFDLACNLVRTRMAAWLCFAVACGTLAAVVSELVSAVPNCRERVAGRLCAIGCLAGAASLVVLADCLPIVALGLQFVTLGTAVAMMNRSGGSSDGRAPMFSMRLRRALKFALCSDALVVVAAVACSMPLTEDVESERVNLALVSAAGAPDPLAKANIGKARFRMATYEGARVSSDDGLDLPEEPLRAPFSLLVEPGPYAFEVDSDGSATSVHLPRVELEPGQDVELVRLAPSTAMRDLRVTRKLSGPVNPTVAWIVGMAVALAVIARVASAAITMSLGDGQVLIVALASPVAVASAFVPFFACSAPVTRALVLMWSAAAAALAARAGRVASRLRVVSAASSVMTLTACVALVMGNSAAASCMVVVLVLGVASIVAGAVHDARRWVQWLAWVAVTGLVPVQGSFFALSTILGAMVADARAAPWRGVLSVLSLAAALLCLNVHVVKMYYSSSTVILPVIPSRSSRVAVVVFGCSASLAGSLFALMQPTQWGLVSHWLTHTSRSRLEPWPFVGAVIVCAVAVAGVGLGGYPVRAQKTRAVPRGAPVGLRIELMIRFVRRRCRQTINGMVHAVSVLNSDVVVDALNATRTITARSLRLGRSSAVVVGRHVIGSGLSVGFQRHTPRGADDVYSARGWVVLALAAAAFAVVLLSLVVG